ncbi:MAG: hypothetical protein ACLRP4_08465 [Dialister invisus]
MFWNGFSVKQKKRNPLEPPCRGAGRSCPSKEIKEVRIINEKKTLSRCGKAEYRVYLTKAVRFIFEKGYLQIRKPVYFSPFLNLEDDGEECREWEKLDNLPEEWEETYDVNTETEILAYKK